MRMAISLFIGPINTQTGLGLVAISLAFAVAQLVWGVSQPIAGAIADRYGAGRVIAGGHPDGRRRHRADPVRGYHRRRCLRHRHR